MNTDPSISKAFIVNCFFKKQFKTIQLPFVSLRQVHHWKQIALIDEHRTLASSGKRNEFDFFEVAWIRSIALMRSFGIDNPIIAKVKASEVFSKEKKEEILNEFQQWIVHIFLEKTPCFLIVTKEGEATVLDREQYLHYIEQQTVSHHLCVSLKEIIDDLLFLFDTDKDLKRIKTYYTDTNS